MTDVHRTTGLVRRFLLLLFMTVICLLTGQLFSDSLNQTASENERHIQLPAGGGISSIQMSDGQLTVQRDASEFLNEQTMNRINLTVSGTAHEDDCFRLEFTETVRGTVQVDGGKGGFDVLEFEGDHCAKVTHHFYNKHDGNIEFDFNGDEKTDFTIGYKGLEPVTQSITASDVTFSFTGGAETITLSNLGAEQSKIVSTEGEDVTFNNPTSSLTINGGTGDDVINVSGYSTAYDVDITFNGDSGNNALNVNGAVNFGAGSFSVNTESFANTAAITSSGFGHIEILSNNVSVGGNLQATGMLQFIPHTASTTIGVGGGSGTLNLTDAEIAYFMGGFMQIGIGDGLSGSIDVLTATFTDPVSFTTGDVVHDGVGTDIDAPFIAIFGSAAPGQSPGILEINGDFTFGEGPCGLNVEIGGTTPGTGAGYHDQLKVTGTVTLTDDVTLSTSAFGGFIPSDGDAYTIIDNDDTDAVSGTFNGLAEGAIISMNFLGSGIPAAITYAGGDDNDVVLTVDSSLPVELVQFSAESTSDGILLKWTTESETDNLGFILERAVGTRHALSLPWTEIASYQTHPALACQSNTSAQTNYKFLDITAESDMTYTYRLSDADTDGNITMLDILEIAMDDPIPDETSLQPPFPNPFNPQTKISYKLAEESAVTIHVYDVNGRLVSTLLRNVQQSPGSYSIHWPGRDDQGRNASSGTYILRMIAGDVIKSQKALLMR